MKKDYRNLILGVLALFITPFILFGQRQMEKLDRGVNAIYTSGKALVSWRIFGDDPVDISFNVYSVINGADAVKENDTPVSGKSNFLVSGVSTSKTNQYFIKPIIEGTEGNASKTFTLQSGNPYYSIPLDKPADIVDKKDDSMINYHANDCSVGDVDGDGDYEIIVKWMPSNQTDNMAGEFTGNVYLDAYTIEGDKLWRIDLGVNIRAGAHYNPFMVYDLDGDGKAEVAIKTAPGTKDATGNYICKGPAINTDHSKDYRNSGGMILSGPEFLTVFNGLTGKEMSTIYYQPRRHPNTENPSGDQLDAIWGDSYGNRVDRFLACVAYLDGVHPSLVMCRGYYTRTVLVAYDFKGGELAKRWIFDTMGEGKSAYAGQGNHNLSVADVDGDGKDEIIYGSMTVDDDGNGLYTTGLGHGDAMHVGDLDPNHDGLEVFVCHEDGENGSTFRDAKTGEILWQHKSGGDNGRGVAFDIDPNYPGAECWSADGKGIYNCATGDVITATYPTTGGGGPNYNMAAWWDGDLQRELVDRTVINKWNWISKSTTRVMTVYNYEISSNNSTKSNPCLIADFWGDWREEILYRRSDNTALYIFSTSNETNYGFYTLMHDPQYREAIAWQNVGYNQPAHPGFFLGDGMKTPPTPNSVYISPDNQMQSSYYQSVDTMGFVAIQAENYTESVQGANSDSWLKDSTNKGYFESGYVTAPSASSYAPYVTAQTDAPKLTYFIDFTHTGAHYIWAHVNFPDGNGDSFSYGLDGTISGDGQKVSSMDYNQWTWAKGSESFDVSTNGLHELAIYAREKGMKVDMLIITGNANFDPTHLPENHLLAYIASTSALSFVHFNAPDSLNLYINTNTYKLPDLFLKYSNVDQYAQNGILFSQTPDVNSEYLPNDDVTVNISATDYFGNAIDDKLAITLAYRDFAQTDEGLIYIQAEDYSSKRQGSNSDDWVFENKGNNYYNEGYMTAPSKSSYSPYTTALNGAPALSFDIEFTKTGKHYIWAHYIFADGSGDSFYFGLDSTIESDNHKVLSTSFKYNFWEWNKGAASFNVETTGLHTLTIYSREKNMIVDMLILTNDPDYSPGDFPEYIVLKEEATSNLRFKNNSDKVTIQNLNNGLKITSENTIRSVVIYDLWGRELFRTKTFSKEAIVPIVETGMLIIKVESEIGSICKKFIR